MTINSTNTSILLAKNEDQMHLVLFEVIISLNVYKYYVCQMITLHILLILMNSL